MKNLILLLFVALMGQTVIATAQNSATQSDNDAATRAATATLTTKYNLNADQAKQMYTILARKARNLAEIDMYRTADVAKYNLKLRSIQDGTMRSIRQILRNRQQVDIWSKTQRDTRNQRAAKRKEMLSQGASKDAITTAELAIFAE